MDPEFIKDNLNKISFYRRNKYFQKFKEILAKKADKRKKKIVKIHKQKGAQKRRRK